MGRKSWALEDVVIPENHVDSAKVKDIDFSIDQQEYDRAIRYWELIIEGSEPKTQEEKEMAKDNMYTTEYYIKRYGNKEIYANTIASFETYAVILPNGEWYEKGKMGLWGMSSETHDEAKQWAKSYKEKFLDTADPEWTLTIVDCHI
jgi:hypothetical protein